MNFQISNGRSASQPTTENLKFERADWTSFRTVEGLQQKAGVPAGKLRRLVLKELTDNALDAGARSSIGELPNGGYFIEDDGPGIDGDAGRDRPAVLHRPPDGLDQAAAAADTRRARQRPARGRREPSSPPTASWSSSPAIAGSSFGPSATAPTTVASVTPVEFPVGTRIEIGFGPAIPEDERGRARLGAVVAIEMARGQSYAGQVVAVVVRRPAVPRAAVGQRQRARARTGGAPRRLHRWAGWRDRCRGRAGPHDLRRRQPRSRPTTLLKVARSMHARSSRKRLGAVGPDLFPDAGLCRVQRR